ncbi:MAG: hypothetical protein HKN04_09295 [Rhodothermaceae bacterium]|nr:hypothetical protein [Rhodothermaceae bacterium]
MPSPRKKSDAYVEAMVSEAVTHVEACIRTPLEDLGYAGPHTRLNLTDGQHDFLAGYIYGALERLLELGELDSEDDVEKAANRLYGRLLGPFDTDDFRPWHMWVVREGIKQVQRPHAMLGYCAGRGDIVDRLRSQNFRAALGPALDNLSGRTDAGGDGQLGPPPYGGDGGF